MRRIAAVVLSLLLLLPLSWAAMAQDKEPSPLYGSWRLVSFRLRIVGEEGPPRDIFGPHPFGRLVFTPAHTMMAFLSRPGREPAASDAEAAALMKSMLAYTGRFRVEGATFTTTVDGNWSEVGPSGPQMRRFKIDGDTLTITTPEPPPSRLMTGKRMVGEWVWQREE